MWPEFACLLKKELLLVVRRRSECLQSLVLFLLVVTLFPLTLGQDPKLLMMIAPGIIWIAALLAVMLSISLLFNEDKLDGSLAQSVLSPLPLSLIVISKLCAHWLLLSLPLLLLSPLLGLLFNLPVKVSLTLMLSLLLGTPTLQLLAGFAAALSVGLRQTNVLLALVLLPLFVPVLVFACGSVRAVQQASSMQVPLLFLTAFLIFALTLLPMLIGSALRISVNYQQ